MSNSTGLPTGQTPVSSISCPLPASWLMHGVFLQILILSLPYDGLVQNEPVVLRFYHTWSLWTFDLGTNFCIAMALPGV